MTDRQIALMHAMEFCKRHPGALDNLADIEMVAARLLAFLEGVRAPDNA